MLRYKLAIRIYKHDDTPKEATSQILYAVGRSEHEARRLAHDEINSYECHVAEMRIIKTQTETF